MMRAILLILLLAFAAPTYAVSGSPAPDDSGKDEGPSDKGEPSGDAKAGPASGDGGDGLAPPAFRHWSDK